MPFFIAIRQIFRLNILSTALPYLDFAESFKNELIGKSTAIIWLQLKMAIDFSIKNLLKKANELKNHKTLCALASLLHNKKWPSTSSPNYLEDHS